MANKRREEKEIFGRGGTASRFKMRQKLVSIGDDFVIENDRGQRVYKVDGKVLRIRQTLDFKDMDGRKLAQIQERMLRITDTMAIEDADGRTVAEVKKALIAPLRERYTVRIRKGPDMHITGNILDYEYKIEERGRKVAEISKRWFTFTDTYGVEIAPGHDEVLILAATVAVDMMSHPDKQKR